nr:MAG TPA: hypothetical protein [Caudoviricetes sp.]
MGLPLHARIVRIGAPNCCLKTMRHGICTLMYRHSIITHLAVLLD